MQTPISTFLWYDTQAVEAARLYCEIFPESKLTNVSPQSASFEIAGQRYIAFNGGKHFKLSPAVSLFVSCETQAEVDALWSKFLAAGGTESQCGWLTDKFGLSWQIIPTRLLQLMGDPDREKANRVVQCMMGQHKIDVAALERAYRGD